MAINIIWNAVPYWHESCNFPSLLGLVAMQYKSSVSTQWDLSDIFLGQKKGESGIGGWESHFLSLKAPLSQ